MLARKSALSYKAKEENITILDKIEMAAPKTKDYVGLLNNLKLGDKKTLVVVAENDKNMTLSSRNIQNSKVVTADSLNTYDLLNAESVVLSESSVGKIENLLK